MYFLQSSNFLANSGFIPSIVGDSKVPLYFLRSLVLKGLQQYFVFKFGVFGGEIKTLAFG